MNVPQPDIASTVVLYDIPWSTYKGITDALPEQRFRHTYDSGTLELFSPLVYHVPRESYEAILQAFGDRRFRHTYIDEVLEIMAPSQQHEWIKEFLGHLIALAALELNISIKSIGSTTLRHPDLPRGLEPDLSYYVQHERDVRSRHELDLNHSPPPDLVVEVEVTHKMLQRLEAYATLGVPEVWRFKDDAVQFFVLRDQCYETAETSLAIPALNSRDVSTFLKQLDEDDENTVLRAFVKWLRDGS